MRITFIMSSATPNTHPPSLWRLLKNCLFSTAMHRGGYWSTYGTEEAVTLPEVQSRPILEHKTDKSDGQRLPSHHRNCMKENTSETSKVSLRRIKGDFSWRVWPVWKISCNHPNESLLIRIMYILNCFSESHCWQFCNISFEKLVYIGFQNIW